MSHQKELPSTPLLIDQHVEQQYRVDIRVHPPRDGKHPPKAPSYRPNLTQLIERREWENARLRKELDFQRNKEGASVHFLEEVRGLAGKLLQTANIYEDLRFDIEEDECDKRRKKDEKSNFGPRGTISRA